MSNTLPAGFTIIPADEAPVRATAPVGLPAGFSIIEEEPAPNPINPMTGRPHVHAINPMTGQPQIETGNAVDFNAGAVGIANGASLGFADEAGAVADVAFLDPLRTAVRAVVPGGEYLAAEPTGQTYEQRRDFYRDEQAQAYENAPGSYIAGNVLGGLATAVPAAPLTFTGRGIAGGSTLGPMIARGAGDGAIIGAVSGLGNAEGTLGQQALATGAGAGFGLLGGAIMPVAGAVGGGITRWARQNRMEPIDGLSVGQSTILRNAADGAENGLGRIFRGEMGPEAMLLDSGDSMLGLAQGAATGTGRGRNLMVDRLRARDTGTATRLTEVTDRTLGPAPVVSKISEDIRRQQTALAPHYQQALKDAGPVDMGATALRLDQMLPNLRGEARAAVLKAREFLNIPGTQNLDTRAGVLLGVRQELDDMLANPNMGPNAKGIISQARGEIDAGLASAAPAIKGVDARFAELAKQEEALQMGGKAFTTGRTEVIRPEEMEFAIRSGARPSSNIIFGPSAQSFRTQQGARAEVERQVGTKANDLRALEGLMATPNDYNSQKYGLIFGEPARQELADALSINRTFRDNFGRIVQGSQTAQRTQAAKALEAGEISPETTLTGMGLRAAQALSRGAANAQTAANKDVIADLISDPQKAQMLAGILLQQLPAFQAAGTGVRNAISGTGSRLGSLLLGSAVGANLQ